MTKQEIQDRNKQIALMFGYEISENGECFKSPNKYKGWIELNVFDSDWDWLMESVEFIRLKNWSYDMYCPSTITDTDSEFECNFWNKINPEIQGRSKISLKEAVFIAISNFAKKFNNL